MLRRDILRVMTLGAMTLGAMTLGAMTLGYMRPGGNNLFAGLAVRTNADANRKTLRFEGRPEGGTARNHQAFDQT